MTVKEMAIEWWENLSFDDQEYYEIAYNIHGHDIGTTEEDIVNMYNFFKH